MDVFRVLSPTTYISQGKINSHAYKWQTWMSTHLAQHPVNQLALTQAHNHSSTPPQYKNLWVTTYRNVPLLPLNTCILKQKIIMHRKSTFREWSDFFIEWPYKLPGNIHKTIGPLWSHIDMFQSSYRIFAENMYREKYWDFENSQIKQDVAASVAT